MPFVNGFNVVNGIVQVTSANPSPPSYAGGKKYNAAGECYVSNAAPTGFVYNAPYRFAPDGALYISNAAPVVYQGGLPFTATGALCVSTNPGTGYIAGLPINSGGIVISNTAVPSFWAPLRTSLIPVTGGTLTFNYSRAAIGCFQDQDNVVRRVVAGEARFHGARRVRNCVGSSEALAGANWAKSNVTVQAGFPDPLGGNTAFRITGQGSGQFIGGATGLLPDDISINSWWIRAVDSNFYIGLFNNRAAINTTAIDNTWRRYASPPAISDNVYPALYFVANQVIDVWHPQVEVISGQANLAPGEYQPTGVLSSPWNGTGVDGSKYYEVTNPNRIVTNLCPYSQAFSVAFWAKNDVVMDTTGGTVAPDGSLTTNRLTDNAVNGMHRFYTTSITNPPGPVTVSIYAKKAVGSLINFISINLYDGGQAWVVYNINTGALASNSGAPTTVEALPDGWYRFSVTLISAGTVGLNVVIYASPTDLGSVPTYAGNGSQMYVWGIQVEVGSTPSPYIATTSSSATSGPVTQGSSVPILDTDTVLYHGEGARTNLCIQSQAFDAAAWNKTQTTVQANLLPAPDGTNTAEILNDTVTAAAHNIYQFIGSGTTVGQPGTFSIYMKKGSLRWVQLAMNAAFNLWANFDLQAGVIGFKSAGTTASIQALPNGWYRCVITGLWDSPNTYAVIHTMQSDVNGYGPGYAGGSGSILLWGAQVEPGDLPGSYIPTTTVAVTRATDALQYSTVNNMPETNYTAYFEQARQVDWGNSVQNNIGNAPIWLGTYTGNASAIFGGYGGPTLSYLTCWPNAWDIQANIANQMQPSGPVYKNAFTLGANNINGNFAVKGTSAPVTAAVAKIAPWTTPTFNVAPNGGPGILRIRNIKFFPVALSAAELQALTT
jgi:hypothetical protein